MMNLKTITLSSILILNQMLFAGIFDSDVEHFNTFKSNHVLPPPHVSVGSGHSETNIEITSLYQFTSVDQFSRTHSKSIWSVEHQGTTVSEQNQHTMQVSTQFKKTIYDAYGGVFTQSGVSDQGGYFGWGVELGSSGIAGVAMHYAMGISYSKIEYAGTRYTEEYILLFANRKETPLSNRRSNMSSYAGGGFSFFAGPFPSLSNWSLSCGLDVTNFDGPENGRGDLWYVSSVVQSRMTFHTRYLLGLQGSYSKSFMEPEADGTFFSVGISATALFDL